jgi:hypothetical protein
VQPGKERQNQVSDEENPVREIRINPIIPAESVLVATARSMRPRKQEDPHRGKPVSGVGQ